MAWIWHENLNPSNTEWNLGLPFLWSIYLHTSSKYTSSNFGTPYLGLPTCLHVGWKASFVALKFSLAISQGFGTRLIWIKYSKAVCLHCWRPVWCFLHPAWWHVYQSWSQSQTPQSLCWSPPGSPYPAQTHTHFVKGFSTDLINTDRQSLPHLQDVFYDSLLVMVTSFQILHVKLE